MPVIVTPRTDAEVACGIPTLIAECDLDILMAGLRCVAPERRDLIGKFEEMKTGR